MDLSVVVVSWNVQGLLIECLKSVYGSLQGSGIAHEVFVVDNASADDSAEAVAARFPQAELIANSVNRGFAAANNQALKRANGRLVVLLNPDTVVVDDALGVLMEFMQKTPTAGMCGPKLVYEDGSFQHSAFRFPSLCQALLDFVPLHPRLLGSRLNGRYPRSLYAAGQPFCIDHPLGACMTVRREAVAQAGGLDEQFFMYCEEVDWAMRIKRAGWQVYCVPAAEVVHYSARSTRQFRDEMFVALWRSRFRLFGKHYGRAFNWAVRYLVRFGLWRSAASVKRQGEAGLICPEEMQGRLAAYERVRDLTYE